MLFIRARNVNKVPQPCFNYYLIHHHFFLATSGFFSGAAGRCSQLFLLLAGEVVKMLLLSSLWGSDERGPKIRNVPGPVPSMSFGGVGDLRSDTEDDRSEAVVPRGVVDRVSPAVAAMPGRTEPDVRSPSWDS